MDSRLSTLLKPPSCVITTLTRPCTKGAQFIFDNEDRMSAYCTNELSDISAFLEGRKLHQDRSSKFKEGTEIYSDELGKVKGIKEYIIHIGIQKRGFKGCFQNKVQDREDQE
ncbi:hypothetical protein GlirM_p28 [Rhizophagus irregularis DAOM 181602=DAOM 197198]|nr:hypothetical protein GlirM_p28 [Rhizophagus irregularis DAOM 181602=DAOM 197198]